jgi:hypothetical protein
MMMRPYHTPSASLGFLGQERLNCGQRKHVIEPMTRNNVSRHILVKWNSIELNFTSTSSQALHIWCSRTSQVPRASDVRCC